MKSLKINRKAKAPPRHPVMSIKQVKNKVEKKEKKVEVETIFDKSGNKKVAVGKKVKKKNNNDMDLSFYNLRQKSYSKDNN